MGLAAGCGDVIRGPCSVQCHTALYMMHCTDVPPPPSAEKRRDGKKCVQPKPVDGSEQKAIGALPAGQDVVKDHVGLDEESEDDCSDVHSVRSSVTDGAVSLAADTEGEDHFSNTEASEDNDDWGAEPLGAVRQLLEAGGLRRGEAQALEEELGTLNEQALVTALAGAHERQLARNPRNPPHLAAPRELYWNKKKQPSLRHGASFTDVATAPAHHVGEWRRLGFSVLAQSRVSVVLLCGGTGERPFSDLGLPSGKSLLQLFCERLRRLSHLARRSAPASSKASSGLGVSRSARSRIPLFVMTDPRNHLEVSTHLKDNDHFGLDAHDVRVFTQTLEPIFNKEGRVLLESPGQVARAPAGGGAMFDLLRRAGLHEDMLKRGLSHVYVLPCDNIKAHIGDPLLLGYSVSLNAECSLKVVARSGTSDSLGVFCTHRPHKTLARALVVERFELHEEARLTKGKNGRLKLGVSSLAHHVFTLAFLMDSFRLPVVKPHAVPTALTYFDPSSEDYCEPEPKHYNALRLETFVSDAFEKLEHVPALLVDRVSEYALVTVDGNSEITIDAALALSLLHQRWIVEAGGSFRDGRCAEERLLCEVSPLVSYSGEGLEGQFHGDMELPFHLGALGEESAGDAANGHGAVRPKRLSSSRSPRALPDHAIAELCSEGEELPPTPPEETEQTEKIAEETISARKRRHTDKTLSSVDVSTAS